MKNIYWILFIVIFITAGCQDMNSDDGNSSSIIYNNESQYVDENNENETIVAKITQTPTPEPEPVLYRPERVIIPDIQYVPDGIPKQQLDLFLPIAENENQVFPIIMMIHQGNSDKRQMSSLAINFADQGFAIISIDHREEPKYQFPANVEDAVCALGWIYSNADDYGFDVENIYLLGYSSGGTISAFLGTHDDLGSFAGNCPSALPEEFKIAGVIVYTGIFDYTSFAGGDPALEDYITELLGSDHESDPELWIKSSPISWVDGSEPEFLLLHGENDGIILPSQSTLFAETLSNIGVGVEVHIIPGIDHMSLISSGEALNILTQFLLEKTK